MHQRVPSLPAGGPRAGRRPVRDFPPHSAGQPVSAYAVSAAAATEMLLGAIAHSDGTRHSVAYRLLETDAPDSVIGPLRFDRNGDLTDPWVAIMRVRGRDGAGTIPGYERAVIDRVIEVARPSTG